MNENNPNSATTMPPPVFPNVSYCEQLYKDAVDAWHSGDVAGVLVYMGNHQYFEFISCNFNSILDRGLLEKFVVESYTSPQYNLSNANFSFLKHVFNFCNKDITRKLGEEFQSQSSYVLYRGVSGVGCKRRLRGFSWTSSFEKAKWFATRLELEKPMVYETSVKFDDIYFYCNERNEQEYVCSIREDAKLKRIWP